MLENKIEELMNKEDYIEALNMINKLPGSYQQKKELEKKVNNKLKKIYIKFSRDSLLFRQVEPYFKKAVEYYAEDKYEKSVDQFDRVLHTAPCHKRSLIYRKRALQRIKYREDMKQAEQYLNKALSSHSRRDILDAYNYIKKARELNPESTYADTFTEYSNEYFLKINMEFYSRNMSAAEKLISAKEYSDAFRVLLLLEKKFPDDKKANNLMALCRKRISAERRAVDNKMKERYLKIGDEYYNKSDFIKAIKNYLTALIYGPHDEQIKKKLESARVKSDMKKKRVLNPKAVKAHFQKGMKYYSMGQYKKAIFEWKKVLELDPQHVMARKNIERASELIK